MLQQTCDQRNSDAVADTGDKGDAVINAAYDIPVLSVVTIVNLYLRWTLDSLNDDDDLLINKLYNILTTKWDQFIIAGSS